eukprot:3867077-Rhodomonas_salina.1
MEGQRLAERPVNSADTAANSHDSSLGKDLAEPMQDQSHKAVENQMDEDPQSVAVASASAVGPAGGECAVAESAVRSDRSNQGKGSPLQQFMDSSDGEIFRRTPGRGRPKKRWIESDDSEGPQKSSSVAAG